MIRGSGIPFHRRAAAWYGIFNNASAPKRVQEDNVKLWGKMLKMSVFKKDFAPKRKELDKDLVPFDEIMFRLTDEARYAFETGDLNWFNSNIQSQYKKTARNDYVYRILRRFGSVLSPEWIDEPRLIVSTIHGAKGGEADCVFLFKQLSNAGLESWNSNVKSRDEIIRTFYVGLTRARETLYVCGQWTGGV